MTEVAKLKQLPSAHVAKTKLSEAQKLALETERLARESDVQIPTAQVKRSSIKELLAKTKEKVKQNIELREKLAQVKESPRLTHDRCIGNVLNVDLSDSDDDSKDGSDEDDGLVVLKQVAPVNACVAKRRDLVKLDLKERLSGLREREWEEMMEEHKMDNEELSEDGDGEDEDAGFLFGKENEDFEENDEDDESSDAEGSEVSASPSDEHNHDEGEDGDNDNSSDESDNESQHSVPSTTDAPIIQSTNLGRKRLLRVDDGPDGDESIVDDNAPSGFTAGVIDSSNAEVADGTESISIMQPKKSRRIEIEEDEDIIATDTQQIQAEDVSQQTTVNIFMSKINAETICTAHEEQDVNVPKNGVGLNESKSIVLPPTTNADEKSDEEDAGDEANIDDEEGDEDEREDEEDQEEIDEAEERQSNQGDDEAEKAAASSDRKDNDLVQLVDEIEERDKAFLKRITLPAEYRQLVRDGENSESEGEDLMETHVKDLEDLLRPEVATEEDKKMIDKNENIDRKHDKEAVEEHRRWEEQKHMDDMERINSFITADAKDVSELEMIRFSIRRSRRNARFEKMQTGILSESNTVFLSDSEDEAENAESIHRRLKRIRKRMKNANPESFVDDGSLLGDDSASNSLLGMIQPAFENENSKSSNGGGAGISFRSEMSPLSSTLGISKAGMFGSYLNKAAKDTRTSKPSNPAGLMKRFVFNCENSSSNHSFKDEEKSPLPGKQSLTSKSPSASQTSIGGGIIKMSRYSITCPTESRSLPASSASPSAQQKSTALLDSNKLRLDGRSPDHIRSIYMKTGVVSQATGSAYFENNNTRIICSIYGPRQIPGNDFSDVGKINCEFSYAPFARPLRKKTQDQNQANEEKTISTQIQQAIQASVRVEKFPKCLLDVFVVVLQADGGVLSAAITCASLALSDAGIETYDLVASCSVGCLGGSTIVMDPNADEEQNKSAQVTLALMPSLHEVTAVLQNGVLNTQQISEAMDLCMDGCSKIFALQRQCLVEKAERIMSQKRTLDQANAQE